ncbi:MAG: hypothetical protein EXX96DRAFT_483984 [Benjaminiella poitrasii]|nr:MAG: hypothetical protein EXX96DRAFT_483984 [Benjaminiella poitrasii]
MAAAIKLYFQSEHQVILPNNAITLVPLEGEGKVEDRVNHLYAKLLDNSEWLEAVSSADVIMWATHSQGTPVSLMLLHRLLERGHIHLIRQSVTLLAMAGISQGPFPALKGNLYFEADAARELFEFMDPESPISIKYRQSVAYVLKCGVKVVLTGSMQDQVVPLHSALMSSIQHPCILRSMYIDAHLYYSPDNDFLIRLIIFALRLHNIGLSDHDLLICLSEVLAGSLYALEGGHSTIYEEIEVYMTATRYTFETAPFGKHTRRVHSSSHFKLNEDGQIGGTEPNMTSFSASQQLNPFYLPWALRGICHDARILENDSLKEELNDMLHLFEQWDPTSARLKELRFKLDPLKTIKLK